MSKYNPQTDFWSVYIHTVPKELTGYEYDKYYVGITKASPKERWQNGYGYKGQIFYKAIEKYGWQNIRHQVIAQNLSVEDAISLEKFLIVTYDSLNGHYGYNVTTGGDGFNGCEMQDSTVKKLREISKKKWKNEEYIKHVKEKLPRGENHARSRPVVLLNTREIFATETEAQKKYNISSPGQFILFCDGKTNCEKKDDQGRCLTWVWYEDYIQMSEEEIINRINESTIYLNRRPLQQAIVCLNTNKVYYYGFLIQQEYPSIKKLDGVFMCCRHLNLSSGIDNGTKLVWRFYDEYKLMTKEKVKSEIEKANAYIPNVSRSIKILDKDTNIIYPSMKACERATGIAREIIKKAISDITYYSDKNKYKTRFERIREENNI